MTTTDIDNLEGGRELDAVVAEKVMGWEVNGKGWFTRPGFVPRTPKFSTDIAAAWQVVDRLRESDDKWFLYLEECDVDGVSLGWEACFGCAYRESWVAFAPTASLAICRAALQAVAQRTGKCDACEREFPADQLVVGPDPFAQEIHHDDTPRTMCENCRHESAMDI